MSCNFDHISPFLTRELDIAWPAWKSEVPEDNVEGLDEESLIQLLKNHNRASFYRFVSDKHKQFFTDLFTNQDKSLWELSQELGNVGYERMQKWWEMEEKLNSIILQFRAKGKIDKVEALRPSLNAIKTEVGKAIDAEKQTYNSRIDATKNNSINEISGGDEEITQQLTSLFNTQIGKLKRDNEEMFEDIKRFVYEEKLGLIDKKIDKIENGELPIAALKRSDLFTDEEITNLREKQKQLLENIFARKRRVNAAAFSDVVTRSGFSNNDDFVQKMNEISDDVISAEAKKAIQDLIKNDFLMGQEETQKKSRSKRRDIATLISAILAAVASALREKGKGQEYRSPQALPRDDHFYQWCNGDSWGWLKHLITVGACSFRTLATIIEESKQGHPVDWNALANVFSFASFMAILFIAGWIPFIIAVTLAMIHELIPGDICDKAKEKLPIDKSITAFVCTLAMSLI